MERRRPGQIGRSFLIRSIAYLWLLKNLIHANSNAYAIRQVSGRKRLRDMNQTLTRARCQPLCAPILAGIFRP
jgi:hypothetical protein